MKRNLTVKETSHRGDYASKNTKRQGSRKNNDFNQGAFMLWTFCHGPNLGLKSVSQSIGIADTPLIQWPDRMAEFEVLRAAIDKREI